MTRTGAGKISYVSIKHPISLYTILSQETNTTKQNLLILGSKTKEGNDKLYKEKPRCPQLLKADLCVPFGTEAKLKQF